ncbi:MAG: hypothetical protein SFY95_05345 [Planctomycetota bacterium]|nr:hypothetical protein [Planctomycetota bacterium]
MRARISLCVIMVGGIAFADQRAEFLAMIQATTPKAGGMRCTFKHSGDQSHDLIDVAFDLASGASVVIFPDSRGIYLLTPSGEYWRGEPRKPLTLAPRTDENQRLLLQRFFPVFYNRAIVERPEIVMSVERTADTWTATLATPGGIANGRPDSFDAKRFPDATTVVTFDMNGRVTTIESSLGARHVLTLAENAPPGFTISRQRDLKQPMFDVTIESFDPRGLPLDNFSVETVKARARANELTVSPALAKALQSPDAGAAQGPDLARYRWPIVTGGAILIGVGLFAWWRNRR